MTVLRTLRTLGPSPAAASEADEAHVAARAADRLLDALVAAFAAWTLVYHACLVLRVHAGWAALLGVLAGVPAAWLAARRPQPPPVAIWRREGRTIGRGRARALLGAALLSALAGAALFAADGPDWPVTWTVWVLAATLALAWTTLAAAGRVDAARGDDRPVRAGGGAGWTEPAVVAAWALGLAAFSLFILAPDADDAYYVHLSTWIEAHGRLPVRDVLFGDQVFPALYFPPVPSYEALVGMLAYLPGLETPDVAYLVVPPAATALSVLALWRLLRTWHVPMPALAVSVAVVFLLFAADENRMLGGYFASRLWQGKVILLCVVIPTLLALLYAYAERPSRRGLALVAASAIAAVGLSTSAIFVLPVIATGSLAPLVLRAPRAAAAGWLAAAAYPVGAGAVTLALGGRQPEVYKDSDMVPAALAHYALGTGAIGFVGMLAVLAGPVLLRPSVAAQGLAAVALAVGLLYTPGVPLAIFHVTDLGRVLWRFAWALPTAALVGAVAVSVVPHGRPLLLRVLPAVAVAAAVAAFGVPLWSAGAGARVVSEPVWKRQPSQIAAARVVLRHARPGDLVLSRDRLSQTLSVMSAKVTTIAPRRFFVRALRGVPAMHEPERELLRRLVLPARSPAAALTPAELLRVRRALRATGVDIACVPPANRAARRALVRTGFGRPFPAQHLACLRAPERVPAARDLGFRPAAGTTRG